MAANSTDRWWRNWRSHRREVSKPRAALNNSFPNLKGLHLPFRCHPAFCRSAMLSGQTLDVGF